MTYEVKPVTEGDRSWVVNTAAKEMLENEVRRPELYNPQQLHLLYHKVVSDGTGLVCLKDGERVGVVGGVLFPHFLNPGIRVLAEVVWYVSPSARFSRAPYLMMKAYRDLISVRADEGMFTLLHDTPIKDDSLAKLGFEFRERHYLFRS